MRTNVVAAVVVTAAAAGFAIGQSTGSGVRMMKLPLDLPAVGNVDSVKQWRLARIEQIERFATTSGLLDRSSSDLAQQA